MVLVAYATEAELLAYLPSSVVAVADAGRLLVRASELLDDHVRRPFATTAGLPDDDDIAAALRDAACAQVEFWLDVGEDHDVEGLAGSGVSIGHMRLDRLPPEVAPRAVRFLRSGGLLSSSDIDTTAARFFATDSGA